MQSVIFLIVDDLGASISVADNDLVKRTILEDLIHGNAKKWLKIVQYVFLAVYAILMARFSFDTLALQANAVSSSMKFPMVWVYMVFPISGVLMLLHSIVIIFDAIFSKKEGETK